MATSTKIEKFSIAIEGNSFPCGDVIKPAQFVLGLVHFFDHRYSFIPTHFQSFKTLIFFDHFTHFLLDFLKNIGSERNFRIKVIVKAGIGGWTNIQLGIRVQAENRSSENMSGGMADFL